MRLLGEFRESVEKFDPLVARPAPQLHHHHDNEGLGADGSGAAVAAKKPSFFGKPAKPDALVPAGGAHHQARRRALCVTIRNCGQRRKKTTSHGTSSTNKRTIMTVCVHTHKRAILTVCVRVLRAVFSLPPQNDPFGARAPWHLTDAFVERFHAAFDHDDKTGHNGKALDVDAMSDAPLTTICVDLMMYESPELFDAAMSLLRTNYGQRRAMVRALDRVQLLRDEARVVASHFFVLALSLSPSAARQSLWFRARCYSFLHHLLAHDGHAASPAGRCV